MNSLARTTQLHNMIKYWMLGMDRRKGGRVGGRKISSVKLVLEWCNEGRAEGDSVWRFHLRPDYRPQGQEVKQSWGSVVWSQVPLVKVDKLLNPNLLLMAAECVSECVSDCDEQAVNGWMLTCKELWVVGRLEWYYINAEQWPFTQERYAPGWIRRKEARIKGCGQGWDRRINGRKEGKDGVGQQI